MAVSVAYPEADRVDDPTDDPQGSLLPPGGPSGADLAWAARLRGTPGCFDELRGTASSGDGALAPVWSRFFDLLGADGWMDLAQARTRIERRVRDDGVTYNVYADHSDSPRSWPLEPLPFMLPPGDWARIEAGVAQRARLLDAALADVYGPRTLLDDGLLPAALVLAHPQYLRAMHGAQPGRGAWLHVVAFDLARAADGGFRVVGQRTQAPSGLGYLLENRLVVAQQFAQPFRELHVQRVAASFQALLQGLAARSPEGERARVVLLTPGPRNETYFEQAFLARWLGIALVEGADLAVRGERLYLKTLHGLERVHVLLRRVDDEWLDPLELRPDSALGVPGLLGALRAGQVIVANAPGAGFVESPGLAAFWPAIARRLLGETLLLPATTTWWCGEGTVWQAQREALETFVIVPTFPHSTSTRSFDPVAAFDLAPDALAAWRRRIDAHPSEYTLQARMKPSEMPVWRDGALEPRAAIVRVYAIADGTGGWRVMPGGLTRVAARRDSARDAWLSMQHGSASADTWVITEGEVDRTAQMPLSSAGDERSWTRRTVTSRAAENLFWLGRYCERTENSVRLARHALESLSNVGDPVLDAVGALAVRHGLVDADVPGPLASLRIFERSLVHALGDATGARSVAFDLAALRECAQGLRERLSQEHWRMIDELATNFEGELHAVVREGHSVVREGHSEVRDGHSVVRDGHSVVRDGHSVVRDGHPEVRDSHSAMRDSHSVGRDSHSVVRDFHSPEATADVLAVLAGVTTQLSALTGAQLDRMTRDDGWRILSIGRQVERLDFLCDVLATAFEQGLPARADGFALLLALFDSTITYRAHFQDRRAVAPLLHLVVRDSENPRAIAWVADSLRERLRKLGRDDPAWVADLLVDFPQPALWSLQAISTADAAGGYATLVGLLRDLGARTRQVASEIGRHYFAHVAPLERTVWQ